MKNRLLLLFIVTLILFTGCKTNEIVKNNSTDNSDITQPENNDDTEYIENISVKEIKYGLYQYVVPENIKEDVGLYYHLLGIKLIDKEKFEIVLEEGFLIKGSYVLSDEKLTCISSTLIGEHITNTTIDEKYIFSIKDNNILELIKTSGAPVNELGILTSPLLKVGSSFLYTTETD